MSEPVPILTRWVEVDGLDESGTIVDVLASEDERRALARHNGLVEIKSLETRLNLSPESRGGVEVTGTLAAKITYTCVVSLEPFDAEVSEPIEVHYLPDDALPAYRAARDAREKAAADPVDEEDEPDAIVGGRIDVGALVAEHLTLGLDPYPKRPGVAFVEPAPSHSDPDASPFAALKALKNNTD